MFLRKLTPRLVNLISGKPSVIKKSTSINNGRCFSNMRSRNEELIPFDYDQIPSDFDKDVYNEMLKPDDAFNVHRLVDLKQLFDCRCHFGHKTGLLNEFMKPYLIGHRQDIAIFDLNQTVEHLKLALNFAAHIAFRDGIILFVNSNKETNHLVERAALEAGEYSQCRDFEGRSFLDSTKYFDTPIRVPDLLIIFRTKKSNFEQHPIIHIFNRLLIPSIGIVDSDSDPRLITYPIPANDDTHSSIELFANLFKEAILIGKQKRRELIKQGNWDNSKSKETSNLDHSPPNQSSNSEKTLEV